MLCSQAWAGIKTNKYGMIVDHVLHQRLFVCVSCVCIVFVSFGESLAKKNVFLKTDSSTTPHQPDTNSTPTQYKLLTNPIQALTQLLTSSSPTTRTPHIPHQHETNPRPNPHHSTPGSRINVRVCGTQVCVKSEMLTAGIHI